MGIKFKMISKNFLSLATRSRATYSPRFFFSFNWRTANKSEIDNKEFAEVLANLKGSEDTKDWVVLDVREESERKNWNLPEHTQNGVEIPKINIRLLDLLANRGSDLEKLVPKDKTVFCMCRGGVRSFKAQNHLLGNGYKTINLYGGSSALESTIPNARKGSS
eukprot:TRINITY_DN1907_c0_g1_i1.p1 TRINITY_DN1907_c0_g1~~TRINITY_DN1907_c0_g1_i1.p1  ORF type:complete len:163 (+),score=24.06 TRINITY_DN1907_c0_g1_i1:100-588(+)